MKANHTDGTEVSIHAGFPNPATDRSLHTLDLHQLLIQHTHSTYFVRIRGHEWSRLGIFDDDIALVDKALDPGGNDIVMWWKEGDFMLSTLNSLPLEATVWGVITAVIHQFRGKA
ncbi:MAG: lexA 1 [Candidatus Saccharibacteria bacterium]|nr:lexA 1 [Candidatus Saccharibacteria bacterium]